MCIIIYITGLCNEIKCIVARFWWGVSEDDRRIYWERWEKLCRPKGAGRMGFGDVGTFNKALLDKPGLEDYQ